jgi:hypothetical protein
MAFGPPQDEGSPTYPREHRRDYSRWMLSRTDRGGRIHSEIIRLTPTELAEIVTQAVVFVFGSERIEGPLQFLAEQAAADALDRARFCPRRSKTQQNQQR